MKLNLSPQTRLRLTFDRELALDPKKEVFDEERYRNFVQMYGNAVGRRDKLLRSVLISDALLLMVISGHNVPVPGLGVDLIDIPGILPILLVLASLAFAFLGFAFFNEQSYQAIVSVMNSHRAARLAIDLDFLTASDVFQEWTVKLYAPKMHAASFDFFDPGNWYRNTFWVVSFWMLLILALMALLHFWLLFMASIALIQISGWSIWTAGLVLFVVSANTIGLLVVVTLNVSFEFTVSERTENDETPAGAETPRQQSSTKSD